MADYELHDSEGSILQKGSRAQVLQYLASREGHESKETSLARLDKNEKDRAIERDIRVFDAACVEFNRMHDHLKNANERHAALAREYAECTEQEFDTLYESAQARNAISVKLTKEHLSFMGISEAWDKAYGLVVAAVEKLDSHDPEVLRAVDPRIGAVPRYAA